MNILSLALGSLGNGVLQGSPVHSLADSLLAPQQSGTATGATSGLPTRDSVMAEQPGIIAGVNLLQQAAGSLATGSQTDDSAADQLSFPALPAMPAPQAAPQVPTDDHGQSNIVFSDADSDSSLIH